MKNTEVRIENINYCSRTNVWYYYIINIFLFFMKSWKLFKKLIYTAANHYSCRKMSIVHVSLWPWVMYAIKMCESRHELLKTRRMNTKFVKRTFFFWSWLSFDDSFQQKWPLRIRSMCHVLEALAYLQLVLYLSYSIKYSKLFTFTFVTLILMTKLRRWEYKEPFPIIVLTTNANKRQWTFDELINKLRSIACSHIE